MIDDPIVNHRRAVIAVRAVFQECALGGERGDWTDLPHQRGGERVELALVAIHIAVRSLAARIEAEPHRTVRPAQRAARTECRAVGIERSSA